MSPDKDRRLNVRITEDESALLQALADRRGVSASDLVRQFIRSSVQVTGVVRVSTERPADGCAICKRFSPLDTDDRFAVLVDHYIADHGLVLLYIGTESSRAHGVKGGPIMHFTVAVLGQTETSD